MPKKKIIKTAKSDIVKVVKVEDYGIEEKKITYSDGTIEIVSGADYKE